ncbi:hypothetical protein J6590_079139 [Homalodisca vitripennis]|nr:hypothetical protein J6590_079139 [Homalodisca vitripennis]
MDNIGIRGLFCNGPGGAWARGGSVCVWEACVVTTEVLDKEFARKRPLDRDIAENGNIIESTDVANLLYDFFTYEVTKKCDKGTARIAGPIINCHTSMMLTSVDEEEVAIVIKKIEQKRPLMLMACRRGSQSRALPHL